jgi:hypothetical protein
LGWEGRWDGGLLRMRAEKNEEEEWKGAGPREKGKGERV